MIKYFCKKRKQGQSTLEYAILIIIIIGALLSLQVYIKRGVQGRLKSATDDIGDQFSRGNTNIQKTTTVRSYTRETNFGGDVKSTLLNNETTTTNESSYIINDQFEYWKP